MQASWCLQAAEMTLSNSNDTVVWELSELLAADRRAKAFSKASVAGELAERSLGFETSRWHKLGDDADADADADKE